MNKTRPTEPIRRPSTQPSIPTLWFEEEEEPTSKGEPPPLLSPPAVAVPVLEVDVEEPCACGRPADEAEAADGGAFGATVVFMTANRVVVAAALALPELDVVRGVGEVEAALRSGKVAVARLDGMVFAVEVSGLSAYVLASPTPMVTA